MITYFKSINDTNTPYHVDVSEAIKRIKNGSLEKDDEDVVNDLIGYLVLLKISG
jgi:predicted RNA-binding protein associated with RNAse of E/G family